MRIMHSAHVSNVMLPLAIALAVAGCGDASSGGGTFITPVPTNDPLYGNQWHLKNTGQGGGTSGEDANVEPVWSSGRKGEGVLIAVVDDGLEINHPDLQPNILANQSHNYLNGTTDPTPTDPTLGHGTSVGGVAAARDLNNLGGRGAAPRAQLVGYNLIATGGELHFE